MIGPSTARERLRVATRDRTAQDIAGAGLGLLALALGAGAIVGVARPPEGVIPGSVPYLAFVGLLAGVVGLYLAGTRGIAHNLAVLGTGVALVGLALFGGSVAIELLLEVDRSA